MFVTIRLLAKHSLIYGVGDLLSRSVGFLMIPIYTHYLSTEQYGTLELLDLTGYVVGMVLSLLVGSNVVRYYHEYPDEHRKRQVISVALINIWVVAIIVLPLLYLSSRQLSQLVFQTPDNFMLVNIILTTLVIGMSNDIPLSLLRIQERSVLFVSISMSRLVVNLGLNVLFVVKFDWGVQGVLVGTLIASSLSGIALTIYVLRGPKLSYSWEIARSMWRYSAPLVGSMVGMFILSFSDRFFLERMTTLSQVGVYSLAARFGMLPSLIVSGPFLQVWGPKQFEIAPQSDGPKIFGRVFSYFWLIHLWVGLGLCVLMEDVISIMAAPEFHDAALYAPVLIFAYMTFGAYSFAQFGILYQKKTTYLAYNTMAVALLSLVSNFLLIPWIGVWGAVITTVISFLLLLATVHFIAQRLYRVSYETRRLVRMSLVAVALYVGSLFISIENTYLSMLVNLLVGLSFPVWLYLVGFYEPEELAAARDLYQTLMAKIGRGNGRAMGSVDPAPQGSDRARNLIGIWGYYGFANTGDEAILHCLLRGMRNIPMVRDQSDVVVFSADPAATRREHNVSAVLSAIPRTHKERVKAMLYLDWRDARRTYQQLDTLVVGGGGLFFDAPDSNFWLLRMLEQIRLAVADGKQVILCGVGVGPLYHQESKEIIKKVFSQVRGILVRDEPSAHLLAEIGVTAPVHVTGDLVFLIEPASSERIAEIAAIEGLKKSARPVIGVTLQGVEAEKPGIREALQAFVRYAVEVLEADIWFIPMQTGGERGVDDRPAAAAVAEEIADRDRLKAVNGTYSPWEVQGVLGLCDAVLAMRLHGAILAIANRTPVFGVSYAAKVSRVFAEIGHSEWQVPIEGLTPENLIEGFNRLWQNRIAVKAELEHVMIAARQRAADNLPLLAEYLSAEPMRQGHDNTGT